MSDTTPVATVTEIDEDSAYTEENDSLLVLLLHGKRPSVEMNASGQVGADGEAGTANLTGVAGGGMQVEDDIGDLDDTQVSELGSKRYNEDSVAEDVRMRCAEDAACKSNLRNEFYHLSTDYKMLRYEIRAWRKWDAAMAETDAAFAEKLAGFVKVVSESVDSENQQSLRISGWETGQYLEQRVQEQWKMFENRWTEKIVQPDDNEAAITQAEHRIRMAVQRGADDRWKNRMANEDKITTNAMEVLRSDLK